MRVLSSSNHPPSSSHRYYYLNIFILFSCCSPLVTCFTWTTTNTPNPYTHQKYSSQRSSSFGYSSAGHSYLFMTNPNNEESTTFSKDQKEEDMQFGKFEISAKNIFYRSSFHGTFGFVNLRPIVPGHVLVTPRRVVPMLSDLTHDEYVDLWTSVRTIQTMLTTHFQQQSKSSTTKNKISFNVAVQDGPSAGQSVPHVHVHILPRLEGDFERNDDVYDELEAWAPQELTSKPKTNIDVPDDQNRHDRTLEQMEEEASTYRNLF